MKTISFKLEKSNSSTHEKKENVLPSQVFLIQNINESKVFPDKHIIIVQTTGSRKFRRI